MPQISVNCPYCGALEQGEFPPELHSLTCRKCGKPFTRLGSPLVIDPTAAETFLSTDVRPIILYGAKSPEAVLYAQFLSRQFQIGVDRLLEKMEEYGRDGWVECAPLDLVDWMNESVDKLRDLVLNTVASPERATLDTLELIEQTCADIGNRAAMIGWHAMTAAMKLDQQDDITKTILEAGELPPSTAPVTGGIADFLLQVPGQA
jgi:hypothetical protein